MAVSLRVIQERQSKFGKVQSLSDFAALCGLTSKAVENIAAKIRYNTFQVKKKSGGYRLIEDPTDQLKYVQDKLNDYLQAIYFGLRSSACYGFCISHDNEEPRNVVSNASRHMGRPYMLNIDFKDFFHQITTQKVRSIFDEYTSIKDDALKTLLTRICTYKGRLPMGAPTSPALSNFAIIHLDGELLQMAKTYGITYTRYADDLSFSCDLPIEHSFLAMVSDAIRYAGIAINPAKVKFFGINDDKTVTGIIVREDSLELQPDYLEQLKKEIDLYKDAQIIDYRFVTQSKKPIQLFRQEIQGKLNFASMVCGMDDDRIVDLRSMFLEEIDFDFVSKSWLDAPYMI